MKISPVNSRVGLTRVKRTAAAILAALLVIYAGSFAFFAFAMRQSPEYFSSVMKHVGPAPFLLFPFESMWKQARKGALRPGDMAPDFALPRLGGSETVRLSSYRGSRPVVLIFGSYT